MWMTDPDDRAGIREEGAVRLRAAVGKEML